MVAVLSNSQGEANPHSNSRGDLVCGQYTHSERTRRDREAPFRPLTSRLRPQRAAATAYAPSEAAQHNTMAAAVEETEAQRFIKEHGPAPRAVPELDEVRPSA